MRNRNTHRELTYKAAHGICRAAYNALVENDLAAINQQEAEMHKWFEALRVLTLDGSELAKKVLELAARGRR